MSQFTRLYRSVLRELGKQSVTGNKFDRPLGRRFRSIVEQRTEGARIDVQNAVDFMAAQRMHKYLLDRYNPLIDLTGEERIEATARRVGFNMPLTPNSDP